MKKPLLHIFNTSIKSGVFSVKLLKLIVIVKVTLIFKSGEEDNDKLQAYISATMSFE